MVRPYTPRFGPLLKTLRTTAGLTQEALAERAGLSVRGLQDLERGQSRRPHQDTVELLAAALGLSDRDRTRFIDEARARSLDPGPSAVALPQFLAAGALVPLVGRASELALLDRFLTGAPEPLGSAPMLLLAGEPGIGKTRLLQAAAQQAVDQGWCVLAGGCHRHGGQEPFAPLLDALARHLHAAEPTHLRALVGCAWLARLLPELAAALEPLPAASLAPEQERRLLFAAVARFLANVAGPAGTLLVLDDLQWAGADALDLLAALLRTGMPLRVVGAYRDTEVRPADPLGLLLADLAQAGLVRRHALGPLAVKEAADLLDDLLVDLAEGERGLVEGVVQRAGGVPFFLVSYAQALHQGSVAGVPWDLAQGVRQRVALLPAAGRELLGVAAVVGRYAPRALLTAVAGLPEEAVPVGLEAACRARLLLEEGADAYVFAHDVIREVVEAELGAAWRAVLHRKVAEALVDDPSGASPETLFYHYDRAGIPDQAVRYLEQAGDHAWAQRAHAAAESHYRAVVARLDGLGRASEAARAREKLGDVLIQAGHYDAALPVLGQAAAAYLLAGDLDGQGRVAVSSGEAHALRGSPEEGIALLHEMLEHLDRSGTCPSLVAVYSKLGQLLFAVGRYDEALAASERATELARAGDDIRMLVTAESKRANMLQMLGRLKDALHVNHVVLSLTEAGGDLQYLVSVHRDLAYMHALRGDFAIGRHHIDRSFAFAEQQGNSADFTFTQAFRGLLALLAGDWRAAQADLDLASALSRRIDRSWYSPYPLIFLARLSLAVGDWAAAAVSVQEALALAQGSGDLQALRWAAPIMAEIDILKGRPEAAEARLVPLLDRPGLEECDVTTLLPVLAWAHLDLGQVDQAADTVDQALARARPEEMRLVLVEALRIQALVALRRGQYGAAIDSVEEGLDLARSMPYPYGEARLLHLAGVLYAEQGAPEAARQRWEVTLASFTR
ncbi:MAG: ATP-binding protein, partial [Chloroflexota bacterium]